MQRHRGFGGHIRRDHEGHALPQSMELNESQTRAQFINPQLLAARWKLDDRSLVRFEIPVDGYDAQPWDGVTDYCFYDFAGSVLPVTEAKRCSRDPREADEQLRHYVTQIAKRQSEHLFASLLHEAFATSPMI